MGEVVKHLGEGNWLDQKLASLTRENHYDPHRRHDLSILTAFCVVCFLVQRTPQGSDREDVEDSRTIGSIRARRRSERYPPWKNSPVRTISDIIVTYGTFGLAWGTVVIEHDCPSDIAQGHLRRLAWPRPSCDGIRVPGTSKCVIGHGCLSDRFRAKQRGCGDGNREKAHDRPIDLMTPLC